MIETRDLKKVYRTEEVETTALENVNLLIREGEMVAIMGPSGCGKSTLLNILGLLDNPSDGAYLFCDQNVSKATERERAAFRKSNIGFVFQNFNLIDELTVFENIELPLLYLKIPPKDRRQRVEDVMDRMQIIPRKNHFAGQWIRHGGWSPDRTMRFFRRDRGRFEERAVHEKVLIQGKTSDLKSPILHYTYSDVSDFLLRSDRYSTLSAREYAGQRSTGPLRMLGHAMYTFVDMYVLKLGFLDGYYGFLLACLYSHYTFCKYAKLKELSMKSSGS